MTILQAIDYLGCHDRLSAISKSLYDEVRQIFPTFIEDQPKYKDLAKIKEFLESTERISAFTK
jgi:histidine ammonia-lyase